MSVTLNVNGTNYTFPNKGESPTSSPAVDWGVTVTLWATAITSGMLQKAGGTFTLTADVDFGASFGLKSAYYKSRNANPAAAGQVRLGNTESIAWRNAANSADVTLAVNASNSLRFNAIDLVPETTNGDIFYFNGTNRVRLGIGSSAQVLTVSSGIPAWAGLPAAGGYGASGMVNVGAITSTSYVDVVGASATITTTGRPVMAMLVPFDATSPGLVGVSKLNTTSDDDIECFLKLVRGSTDIAEGNFRLQYPADTSAQHRMNVPSCVFYDAPTAGTYTYKLQAKAGSANERFIQLNQRFVVFEL